MSATAPSQPNPGSRPNPAPKVNGTLRNQSECYRDGRHRWCRNHDPLGSDCSLTPEGKFPDSDGDGCRQSLYKAYWSGGHAES
jgi:hypothetical protein